MESALERKSSDLFRSLARLREVERAHGLGDEDRALRFSVPRIVCVGEESSGKSSTLERIAMMPVFPRHENLCTRVPIELRLRYREASALPEKYRESGFATLRMAPAPGSKVPPDVLEEVSPKEVADSIKGWMEQLVQAANGFAEGGKVKGVAQDRIIIELYSTRRLNLDLIDLPGIVAGSIPGEPADIMHQTRNLSASFLSDEENPHTFVIAVCSARDARIRNSQAFNLVQEHKKENRTIGALTMVDLSADSRIEEPYARLISRLNNEADDTPELGLGYVAIKNRDTVGRDADQTLEDANAQERAWFETNISSHRESCGLEALVERLVGALQVYTHGEWIHAEKARLEREQANTLKKMKQLGSFVPENFRELVGYYHETLNGWREPSYEKLIEAFPTLYGGYDIPGIRFTLSGTPWTWEDLQLLMPKDVVYNHRANHGNRRNAHGLVLELTYVRSEKLRCRMFDANIFAGESDARKVSRWSNSSIRERDLIDTNSEGTKTVTSAGFHKLTDEIFKSIPPGSLVFVGRKDPFDPSKVEGFFYCQQALEDKLGDEFVRVMLTDLASRTWSFSPSAAQSTKETSTENKQQFNTFGAAIQSRSPIRFGGYAPQQGPSQVTPQQGNPFFFGATASSQATPPERVLRKVRRPSKSKMSTTLQFPEGEIVVLYHEPLKTLAEGCLPSRLESLEHHYDVLHVISTYLLDYFETTVRIIFDNFQEAFVADLRSHDERFKLFHDAVSEALEDWCEERVSTCVFKFKLSLDRALAANAMSTQQLESLFQISAKYGFSNAITTMMRETVLFEYAHENLSKWLESDALEGTLISKLQSQSDEKGYNLLEESCAELRAMLAKKMVALEDMKNALDHAFDGSTPASIENSSLDASHETETSRPQEEDPEDSVVGVRTGTVRVMAQALSRTTI